MYDELTRGDVQKMQEEIDYRTQVLRPKLIEDVQTARAFGDLSENFEYKCAKQEKNRNDSRIRYLQRMINLAGFAPSKNNLVTFFEISVFDYLQMSVRADHNAGIHAALFR